MEDDDIDMIDECWELARSKLIGKMPISYIEIIDRFIDFHVGLYSDQED